MPGLKGTINMPRSRPKKPVPDYFDAVLAGTNERIPGLIADENTRRFYRALLAGGSVAARAVVNQCQGVQDVWAGGDEKKALALTRLFTMMMLSQCYRWLSGKEPVSEEQSKAREAAASNIGHLFGDGTQSAVKEFFNIDIQFKYDLENKSHLVHLGSLLLAKASDACGHRSIDWSQVSFPVKSLNTLTSSGAIIDSAPIRSPDDIRALWAGHAAGVKAMNNCYQEPG